MMKKPKETFIQILLKTGLDVEKIQKVRLQAKPIINSSGKHKVPQNKKEKEIIWYELDDFAKHFHRETNENQINNLSQENRQTIMDYCEDSLKYFGYVER